MFQGLRTNSLFYVLDKGENPNLQIGQVVSVSNPQTIFGIWDAPAFLSKMPVISCSKANPTKASPILMLI